MKKHLILFAALTTITLTLLTACPKKETKKVRVGYIPVTHCIPLYLAESKGLFQKVGLQVELVPLQGGPKILEALISGDIQVGFSNVASIIIARSQGVPIIPISGGPVETVEHRDHALMVPHNSSITSGADLKGKKIAVNSRRNIDHLMLLLYLKKFGLSENDVTLVEVPFPRMEAALSSGSVDIVAIAEPFITIGHQHSLRVVDWNYVAVRPKTFVSTYAATEKYIKENPDVISKFVATITQASEIANNNPKDARASLVTYSKLAPEIAEKVGLPNFSPTLDIENVAETEKLLLDTKLIDKPADIQKALQTK